MHLFLYTFKLIADNKNGDFMISGHVMPVLYRSLISLITLFVVAKVIGKKQISELSLFDYVIGISIGNFAAEMTINLESPEFDGVLAVIIFGGVAYLVSMISMKSVVFRKIVEGEPTIIIQEGNIIKKNMHKVRLDVNELLEEARIKGYFDLSQIEYAIMEANGEMSFLPFTEYQPLTVSDMNKNVHKNILYSTVIIDGKILKKNLAKCGKTKEWLEKQIKSQKYKLKEIILCTIDDKDNLQYYLDDPKIKPIDTIE